MLNIRRILEIGYGFERMVTKQVQVVVPASSWACKLPCENPINLDMDFTIIQVRFLLPRFFVIVIQ